MTRLMVQSFPENVSAVEKGNQSYAEDGTVTTEKYADGIFKLQKKSSRFSPHIKTANKQNDTQQRETYILKIIMSIISIH